MSVVKACFPGQLPAALGGRVSIAVARCRETGTERVRGARVGDTSENRVRVSQVLVQQTRQNQTAFYRWVSGEIVVGASDGKIQEISYKKEANFG